MTVLLGKHKWRREYCQNALVFTAVPTTARSLVGQKVSNSNNHKLCQTLLNLILDALGPSRPPRSDLRNPLHHLPKPLVLVALAPHLLLRRLDLRLDRILFRHGLDAYTLRYYDLLFLEIFPPLYNFLRSPECLPALPVVVLLQLGNRVVTPFFWTYALFTLFDDAWTVSSTVVRVKASGREVKIVVRKEVVLFFLWTIIVFVATLRGICSIFQSVIRDGQR